MQDIFGIMISMFVTAVRPQDKSSTINALAQLPQLFGMEINVLAQLTPSEPTVSLAQPLDSGMVITVLALITESGTVKIVFVEQDYSVQTVFLAQPQDHGTTPLNNVYALITESGTVKIVFVEQDYSVQTVFLAQPQDHGKTPLNNVYAQTTESGTVKTVFALLDFTDQTVNHAHFQENG